MQCRRGSDTQPLCSPIGRPPKQHRHTDVMGMSPRSNDAHGTENSETVALRLACTRPKAPCSAVVVHPPPIFFCTYWMVERRARYKREPSQPSDSPQSSQLSQLLPYTTANAMAFKALLSFISIVAAFQGASGTPSISCSSVGCPDIHLSYSCAHPPCRLSGWQEHGD